MKTSPIIVTIGIVIIAAEFIIFLCSLMKGMKIEKTEKVIKAKRLCLMLIVNGLLLWFISSGKSDYLYKYCKLPDKDILLICLYIIYFALYIVYFCIAERFIHKKWLISVIKECYKKDYSNILKGRKSNLEKEIVLYLGREEPGMIKSVSRHFGFAITGKQKARKDCIQSIIAEKYGKYM